MQRYGVSSPLVILPMQLPIALAPAGWRTRSLALLPGQRRLLGDGAALLLDATTLVLRPL